VRPLLALSALLLLSACGRDAGAPLLDSRTPPALAPRFFAPDGWGWGVIALPGAPGLRYGVVAPAMTPRAHVVILPAYGESAEVYFETARTLTDCGYAVWLLEAAGQGGSGRFAGPTDLGRSNGFGPDAAALEGLITRVIRPDPRQPVILAASGAAVLTVLLAAESGRSPVDGLFLWDPDLAPSLLASQAADMTRKRLGALRATGGAPWARPTYDLSGRSTLSAAWQMANPDLRLGGPAWEWIAAREQARREALAPGALGGLRASVMVLTPVKEPQSAGLCARAAACTVVPLDPSPLPRHLAPDPVRGPWLTAFTNFVEARIAARARGS
jgi:lysophospholipase